MSQAAEKGRDNMELYLEFLKKNFPKTKFQVIPTDPNWQNNYVDTSGNAILTMDFFLKNKIDTKMPLVLVSGKIHARRACLCFEKAGFSIEKLIEVDYPNRPEGEKITGRLFYYQYKWLHRIYEFMAFWRDKLIY